MRLGGQQRDVQFSGLAAAVRGPAQRGAIRGLALAEQQIVRLALDPLAGLEPERFGAWSPPAPGRLSPAFASLDVIAGRVLGGAPVDLLPDLVKVVTLAQRRHHCHYARYLRGPRAAELTTIVKWCMGVTLVGIMLQA